MLITKLNLDGQGTKADPYIIESGRQLLIIRHYPDAYFLQTADIDLEELAFKDAKLPISNQTLDDNYFSGVYDGGNNKIYNLKMEMKDRTSIGLFAALKNRAVIKNLHLVNVRINGKNLVGGITGQSYHGAKIINCSVTGHISGNEIVGGIAGDNDGLIKDSKTDVIVQGVKNIGGLAGRNWFYGALVDSYIDGQLYRARTHGAIFNSKSKGEIRGKKHAGGLVGFNYGLISNSSSSAKIRSGEYNVGQEIGADFSS